MKKFLLALTILVFGAIGLSGQNLQKAPIEEIADVETGDGDISLSVFSMLSGEQRCYYLCVGELGAGDEVLQVLFDPVYKLFIPIGSTLEESIETLEELKARFQSEPDTKIQMEGCFAPILPNDERETVSVTTKKFLFSKKLMFSLEREGYIRATYVSKSDFGSILRSVKWYSRLNH